MEAKLKKQKRLSDTRQSMEEAVKAGMCYGEWKKSEEKKKRLIAKEKKKLEQQKKKSWAKKQHIKRQT